jgi:hypothetical protein
VWPRVFAFGWPWSAMSWAGPVPECCERAVGRVGGLFAIGNFAALGGEEGGGGWGSVRAAVSRRGRAALGGERTR